MQKVEGSSPFSRFMFDHVGVAVSDRAAAEAFYRGVLSPLGIQPTHVDAQYAGWEDWWIGASDRDHPVTRGLHVAFRAQTHGVVLRDPDGNGVETVRSDWESTGPGWIDRLELCVADPQASRRFFATIAPYAGLRLAEDSPQRVRFDGADFSLVLIHDGRPRTEHVHIAFSAHDNAVVQAFHAAALGAGYEDHGAPGERPQYHPGYYGAFVLDPDGHNVEVVNHNA